MMRLTIVILFATLMQVSAGTYAQKVTMERRNVKLQAVFKEIRKQTGYDFIYKDNILDHAAPVNVKFSNVPFEEALQSLFEKQPLTYSINGKVVIVKEKEMPPFPDRNFDRFDNIDVRGRVLDEKGQPLSGATVMIKGADRAINTNANGEFLLVNVSEKAVILIRYLGYKEREIKPATNLGDISLEVSTGELNEVEVVLNTGYQRIPKERATGSFVSIGRKQLESRIATDVLSKLEGITNGLAFNKGGALTGEPVEEQRTTLRIRGESTLFGNPTPLLVVDNFPYTAPLSNLNPNDIENITVLKDAAAASIWGVQAGNGVIVITTKSGQYGRPLTTSFTSNLTLGDKPDLFKSSRIGPGNWIDVETSLFENGYYDNDLISPSQPALSPVVNLLAQVRDGKITQAAADQQIDVFRSHDYRDDLLKYVYQKPINQQYAFNINGGTAKFNYNFSTGFDRNRTNITGNDFNRLTLSNRSGFKILQNLDVSTVVNYVQSNNTQMGTSQINNIFPYMQLVDASGNELKIPQHNQDFEQSIGNKGFPDWSYYPLKDAKLNKITTKNFETRLGTTIKYELANWLAMEASYQYSRINSNYDELLSSQSYEIRNRSNLWAVVDADGNYTGSNYPKGGVLTYTDGSQVSNYGRASLNINKDFSSGSLTAIAGAELRELKTINKGSIFYGFNPDNGTYALPDYYTIYTNYLDGSTSTLAPALVYQGTLNRFRSYFGNASYDLLGKYTISASARLDGTNYFGVKTNQKVVPLWSSGVKWSISKENFYKSKILPELSLRVTYGFNGNLSQNLAAVTTVTNYSGAEYTGFPYSIVDNYPNPELRWEKIGHLNVGLDFAFVEHILSGSIEYYLKEGRDLIGDRLFDKTTGVDLIRGNFSGMRSRGMDIEIKSLLLNKSAKLETALIFNYATNKVTKYDIPYPTGTNLINAYQGGLPVVGKPLSSLFSYPWAGLDPVNGDPRGYLNGIVSKDYAAIQNSIPIDQMIYSGQFNAPYSGSLRNTVEWRGLSLQVNLTYKFNYFFRQASTNYNLLFQNWRNGIDDVGRRWMNPGDELFTNVPSLIYPNNPQRDNFYNNSEALITRADHIRLQFVNLTYNLNKRLVKKLPVRDLQFTFYANNLGVLWKAYKGKADPDYPYLDYPPVKTYSLGLKTTF